MALGGTRGWQSCGLSMLILLRLHKRYAWPSARRYGKPTSLGQSPSIRGPFLRSLGEGNLEYGSSALNESTSLWWNIIPPQAVWTLLIDHAKGNRAKHTLGVSQDRLGADLQIFERENQSLVGAWMKMETKRKGKELVEYSALQVNNGDPLPWGRKCKYT